MHDYNAISKRAIVFDNEIKQNKKIIEAITTTLIGAIGLGHEVKTIAYDKEKIKDVDLQKNINIFKESGKTVDELEKYLLEYYNNLELNSLYLKNEISLLKNLYKVNPTRFLNKYFVLKINKEHQENIFKFKQYITEKEIMCKIIYVDNQISIYYNSEDDAKNIKSFFKEEKINIQNIYEFTLEKENEKILAYLYSH